MELIYLVLLLAALLAMNWRFLGMHRLFSRSGGAPGCRWKRDPTREASASARFVCARCGAEAYRADGAAPRVCLRGARPLS